MGFFDNRIFASFNTLFSRVVNNSNATIVGPSKTLTGEFPDTVSFERLYEYYVGWPQIKRSIDVEHQKFMGAGIKITSNNEDFNDFIEKWWKVTNADKKWSAFFLSAFITGNGLMERQFVPDPVAGGGMVLANIEQIPMQTIFRIFRDQFGNDLKMVQVIDGVFKEINPEFYIRWTLNNPDRQAFGKSEFYSVAAPRKVTAQVDPMTQNPANPDRFMESILDSEAELVDAQVEIKKILARPKIFGSFPGMPQPQLDKIEKEMSDPNNKKYFWAFNKEAKVAEAQISDSSKFDKYQEDLNNLISLAGGFPEKIITNPGGFSYASSATPMDVQDERMATLKTEAAELILDGLVRPLAESFGFDDFDEMDVVLTFMPTPRKLKFDEILAIPETVVPDLEKREMLKELQVNLNDELFEKAMNEQKQIADQMMQQTQVNAMDLKQTQPPALPEIETGQSPPQAPAAQDRPKPEIGSAEYVMKNPKLFETYIRQLVETGLAGLSERLLMTPDHPTSLPNSVNNTTSGRDPNTQKKAKPPGPTGTAPPTDIISTAPTQDQPPQVTDPTVLNQLHQDDQDMAQQDPRNIHANNEPNPQSQITAQVNDKPDDADNVLFSPDLVPANPDKDVMAGSDQPLVANGKPNPKQGQGIGPVRRTMKTEPGGTGIDPNKPETAPDTVGASMAPSQALGDLPPNFPGGIPPVGRNDNTGQSGSRGLMVPQATTIKPSAVPDTPNQQEPSKNVKRKNNNQPAAKKSRKTESKKKKKYKA